MKKFRFLLLDAGPIIKLFQLGLWDTFLGKCEITVSRTVMNEAKWASASFEDIHIALEPYEEKGHIQVIDLSPAEATSFFERFNTQYKAIIDPGEKETLAFLNNSNEPWKVCSTDHAVFRILGLLGKAEQGISLEELLNQIGLSRKLGWQYTKEFRKKNTHRGQTDSVQGHGLIK
jgi:hypothetical protein